MADRLIRLVSYLSLPEAEILRMRLAMDGVRSSLDNATMLLWFWHYGCVVRGVAVSVLDQDVEAAEQILRLKRHSASAREVDVPCAQCGALVPKSWKLCWNCDETADAAADRGGMDASSTLDADGAAHWKAALSMLLWLMPLALIPLGGFLAVCVAWSLMLVTDVIFQRLGTDVATSEGDAISPFRPKDSTADSTPGGWHASATNEDEQHYRRVAEDIALRAWQASVIGLLWFPPLVFYSMWLLWRSRRLPVSLRGRRRRLGALVCSILGLPMAAFVTIAVPTAVGSEAWSVLH